MPLFGKKKKTDVENGVSSENIQEPPNNENEMKNGSNQLSKEETTDKLPVQKPKLVFHCQQAQGSPTGIISGFTNIRELYQKIAECYDFPVSEKGADVFKPLSHTHNLLELLTTLYMADCFNSCSEAKVGDHIEKINGKTLVGCRHFEVAKALKEIEKGSTFTLRLVEPLKAGFSHIGPRTGSGCGKKGEYGSGRETLRLRAKGPATVEIAPDDVTTTAIEKINSLLESFMGINDTELATQIWELGQDKSNPSQFVTAVDNSDLEAFGFTDNFVFDLWGAISDAKAGRLKKEKEDTPF
ncbi:PDZ domain-containing protein GIPC1-like [Limulus polyphemus]|uniref:PDZ domain-containing protein GIPC1-like n=1 Tax=Limulus polyphemus TaxID=6850 RepID=A0ABM1S9R5_LIMPO|nr:PDZ domain-containing protein GIPC1-like [Limulus polyphemus]